MKTVLLAFALILAGCATPKPKPVVADLNPRRAAKVTPDGKRKVLAVWATYQGSKVVSWDEYLNHGVELRWTRDFQTWTPWMRLHQSPYMLTNAGAGGLVEVRWAQ